MSKPFPMTEAEMAAKVVAKLEALGHDVFQEVEGPFGRADIVSVKGASLFIVECKMALGFEVMAQARTRLPFASCVYIAVPNAKRSEGRSLAFECCRWLGLGLLVVDSNWAEDPDPVKAVREREAAPTRSHFNPALRDQLRPEHKTHAKAGTNEGGQMTRFKQTVYALRDYAESHPGDHLRRALSQVDHHYSSIGNAIAKLRKIGADGDLTRLGIELRETPEGIVTLHPVSAP